jgi:DNA (cytosine-5)-methyltransferase 1
MSIAVRVQLDAHELIVDSFAGGGGASCGIEWATGRSPDIAINHDPESIALHAANHPATRHYCENVWRVDPVDACAGRRVGLMWLSPDCKHFSKAKGAKPVEKKVRGLAWVAVRWAKAVKPRVIVLENVEEFAGWGPLLPNGFPCPARKGLTFRRFVGRLRALGYAVEWREFRACDYGAPTTRKRLFLVARCDGRVIRWPAPTHGKDRPLAWRTAAECIDWSIPCPSIFLAPADAKALGVRRPLADATLRRIARGVQRYVIDAAEPFLVSYYGPKRNGDDRVAPITGPLPTQTTENRFAIVDPFLVPMQHTNRPTSIEEPLQTVTTQGNKFNLVAPLLVPRYGERTGQEPRSMRADGPMPTVVPTQNGASLVAAFMAKHYGGHETPGSAISTPFDTVTATDHHALVASSLVKLKGTSRDGQQLSLPLHTVQAGGLHYAEVRAFLARYNGTSVGQGLSSPISTIDTRDRFGLVTVHGESYTIADIGMRMLAPRELYRAQGFPESYRIDVEFKGKPLSKTAQVRMCGNSVCPPLAAAIVRANLSVEVSEVAA